MPVRIRINRFLAEAGLGSRRRCDEIVRSGAVKVNGERVDDLALTVDPETDTVAVDGKRVNRIREVIILILNKPAGMLSTVADTHDRRTVIDIAKENGYSERLFPVGRLDLDTSGLLLLTNDGELTYRLTHPRYKIEKTYHVRVEGRIGDGTVKRIATGIRTEKLDTQPCRLRVLEKSETETLLEIILTEGKKRQIKRMFSHYGHKVIKLHRAALGDLFFDDVDIGDVRPLTSAEERRLRDLCGLG